MAISTNYKQPHEKESFDGMSHEEKVYIEMMVEQDVARIMKGFGNRDPEYARKVAAKLFNANRPPKMEAPGSDGLED